MREFQVRFEKNKNYTIEHGNVLNSNSIECIINNIIDGITMRIEDVSNGKEIVYGFYELDFEGVRLDSKDVDYILQKTQNHNILNLFINEIFNKDYSNILSSHGAKPIILARRLFDEHLDPELTTLIEDCLRNQYGDGVLFAYRNISDTNYEQNMKKNFICKTL